MSYEEEDTYRRFFPSPCCLGCTSPGLVYSVKDLKLQPREETLNFLFFLIFFQKKMLFSTSSPTREISDGYSL
jgi:hypothetical protein